MFKAISRWIWLKLNRKSPKPSASYSAVIAPWFWVGILSFVGGGLLVAMITDDRIVSGRMMGICGAVVILLIAVWNGYIAYKKDREFGVYDAINKASVDYWHKKRKEYGEE